MHIKSKNVLVDNKSFIPAIINIEGEKIFDILDYNQDLEENVIDYKDNYIIPGFIDVHCHGWARGSFWGEKTENSLKAMSNDLAKEGVTSFLATTGADTIKEIDEEINSFINYKNNDLSHCVGVHLEGPFLNIKHKGMQPEKNILKGDLNTFNHWYSKLGENLKIMTIAPEINENLEIMQKYKGEISFNAGHTDATYDQIKEAIHYGLSGITHTFSGQSGFHHRNLGTAGAAMALDQLYTEVAKQTGLTISPEAFKILYRVKPKDKFILCSDSVGYGAYPEGKEFYNYIRKIKFVPKKDLVELHYDDSETIEFLSKDNYEQMKQIELSFNESIKNILKWHKDEIKLKDIVRIACENPAKYIKIFDKKGSIQVNKDADIQVLDDDYNVVQVLCRGKKVF